MVLSDTDSLLTSSSRRMSNWEQWQHRLLKETNSTILYKDSIIGKELASETYRSIHSILDYSSVAKESLLYNSYFKDPPHLNVMFRFLAYQTKKRLSKFQSEVDFKEIAHVHAPACKAYCIDVLSESATIPPTPPKQLLFSQMPNDPVNWIESVTFAKKGKGTRKNVLKAHTTVLHYIHQTKTNNPPQKAPEYSIQKRHWRLYLAKRVKVLVVKLLIKRVSYDCLRRLYTHFTYPFHFKRLVNKS